MKKILAIAMIGIAILFMAGCPEDDIPVKYSHSDVNVTVAESGQRSNETPAPAPEPATLLLLGSGIVGLGAFARKRSKK